MDHDRCRQTFDRDGFVVCRDLLGPAVVRDALDRLDALRGPGSGTPGWPGSGTPGGPGSGAAAIVALAPGDPFGDRFVADDDLVALAATLLGGPVAPFGASYLCKPPRVGLAASWHQDGQPWQARLAGRAAVTLWVALDDADEANGCLAVVPGSHDRPARRLVPDPGAPTLFGVGLDPAHLEGTEGAVPLAIGAGGVIAHHPSLVHGSGANRSERSRTALAVRYRRD